MKKTHRWAECSCEVTLKNVPTQNALRAMQKNPYSLIQLFYLYQGNLKRREAEAGDTTVCVKMLVPESFVKVQNRKEQNRENSHSVSVHLFRHL